MMNDKEIEQAKRDEYIEAAEYIRRTCPHDVGGRMVLAAFMKDSIDHRYDVERKENKREDHRQSLAVLRM